MDLGRLFQGVKMFIKTKNILAYSAQMSAIKSAVINRNNLSNIKTNRLQQSGFSLIESMIVITILSLLFSAAIPSLTGLISKSKISKTSNELFHSLSLARSYAITRNQKVHVCALNSINPLQCDTQRDFNSNWSLGWMVFADSNNNNDFDSEDIVIRSSTNSNGTNIVFNQRGRLRFFPDGRARSAGFYLCSNNHDSNRHIKLLYSGRARTTQIENQAQLDTCLSAN